MQETFGLVALESQACGAGAFACQMPCNAAAADVQKGLPGPIFINEGSVVPVEIDFSYGDGWDLDADRLAVLRDKSHLRRDSIFAPRKSRLFKLFRADSS